MKVAYLFHGHSRTWKDCYQSFFDNVYSVLPGDIYMHTWDRANSKYGSFWNGNLDFHGKQIEEISSKTVDLDSIKNVYNPKHIIVETDRGTELTIKKYPKIKNTNASNAHIAVCNMFESQYKVFKLAEDNGDYDYYFSCRFDLQFTNKLNLGELASGDHLYTPSMLWEILVFDIFSFGSKNIMKIRSEFYNAIWDYWYSKGDMFSYTVEHAVTQYYNDNSIRTKPISLSYLIKRLF